MRLLVLLKWHPTQPSTVYRSMYSINLHDYTHSTYTQTNCTQAPPKFWIISSNLATSRFVSLVTWSILDHNHSRGRLALFFGSVPRYIFGLVCQIQYMMCLFFLILHRFNKNRRCFFPRSFFCYWKIRTSEFIVLNLFHAAVDRAYIIICILNKWESPKE